MTVKSPASALYTGRGRRSAALRPPTWQGGRDGVETVDRQRWRAAVERMASCSCRRPGCCSPALMQGRAVATCSSCSVAEAASCASARPARHAKPSTHQDQVNSPCQQEVEPDGTRGRRRAGRRRHARRPGQPHQAVAAELKGAPDEARHGGAAAVQRVGQARIQGGQRLQRRGRRLLAAALGGPARLGGAARLLLLLLLLRHSAAAETQSLPGRLRSRYVGQRMSRQAAVKTEDGGSGSGGRRWQGGAAGEAAALPAMCFAQQHRTQRRPGSTAASAGTWRELWCTEGESRALCDSCEKIK